MEYSVGTILEFETWEKYLLPKDYKWIDITTPDKKDRGIISFVAVPLDDTKELSLIASMTDDLVKKWVKKLGLELWTITCDYCDSHRFIEIEDNKSALAFCHVRWPYLTATIRFNKDHLQDEPEENLELIVIHELMHIIVNEMRDDENDIDHEERVATVLAKAFLRNDRP